MTYTPTAESVKASFVWQQVCVNGHYGSVEEAGEAFDRWKAKLIQRIQHDAWAEGYSAGSQDGSIVGVGKTPNPYAEES